jgi:hypothetical protein
MGGGAAIGSWASGLLHQLTGGYVASFCLSVAAALIGMMSFWAFPSLREERLPGPLDGDALRSGSPGRH